VLQGLKALPPGTDIVVVHDAARPLVSQGIIGAVIRAAIRYGAALAAIPVQDTLKREGARSCVDATVERLRLWQAQTPQAFHFELLLEAHARASAEGYRGTDDASLVERLGKPVRLVRGSPRNLKVTTREDLALARALFRSS
jgi:2-C-methyl-D-erythritol 4-phosphate cytidylyltransferase